MQPFTMDARAVFAFRFLMGWTFLYAGVTQVLSPDFTVAAFLSHTKTFHDLYAPLTNPTIAPTLTFLVSWGHLLIGLSLVSGLLVRISGVFGVLLMLTYYTAHLDFPYVENKLNFVFDYHIVFALLIGWLVAVNAGRAFGLDGWLAERGHQALPAHG